MKDDVPIFYANLEIFKESKSDILKSWIRYKNVKDVLSKHEVKNDLFLSMYGTNVFDYFLNVVDGKTALGDCPVMMKFLAFLKDRDFRANELFLICTHFKKAMLDFTFEVNIDSQEFFNEINYIFDANFSSVLDQYTQSIFEKEQELAKNVKVLNEYKKAIDASAIVSKTDLDGIVTYANDNLCKLCGYTKGELIGKPHNILRHEDMGKAFYDDLWNTLKDKKVFRGTIKNRKKDGTHFFIDSTIVPIIDPLDNTTEYIAIGYEVTKLIDSNREVNDASVAKEYFFSNMSHEIRTPLNAILGFVSLLQDEVTTKNQKKYLNIIHNSGENLLSIINDILDFSKLRSGEFNIDMKLFNLHDEFSHTLELFVASANSKSISIDSFIDPQIAYEIYSDPLRINQIISNFLSNAIKFTNEYGKINVEATYKNDILYISVKDNGSGISKKDLDRIFNAFSQVEENSLYTADGTGLGLSICKYLAENMGGEIQVESTLGIGSTFTLILPVTSSSSEAIKMFELQLFSNLEFAAYCKSKNNDKMDSLKRYFSAMHLYLKDVDHIDDNDYDLLFFIDDVDDETLKKIKQQEVPSIAIMDKIDDKFDLVENITSLVFPLYCSKIYHTLLEALNIKPETDAKVFDTPARKYYKGKILVVEDNVANQELIVMLLERYGLECALAHNGLQALDMFKKNRYNLILMDEQMPVMNGREATTQILAYESEQRLLHTPIVALSANVMQNSGSNIFEAYDSFLGKPIITNELEKVFDIYLETTDIKPKLKNMDTDVNITKISGVDVSLLQKELMLDYDQIIMLLNTYKKKMDETMIDLKESILKKDYDIITKVAHTIKGSSANFRIVNIVNIAKDIEMKSASKDVDYDYDKAYKMLKNEYEKIHI